MSMNFKIRQKVHINARNFTDKQPQNGVISKVQKVQSLDTGLFTLGLLHFHNSAKLEEKTTYTVVRQIPAFNDQVRLVFDEWDESELEKGWL